MARLGPRWNAMIDRLFSPHLANLQNSLGRTSQRQGLLTNNLANINVPGYKRQDVDFGIALQNEMDRGLNGAVREDKGSIRVDGSSVDLEKEVFAMAETDLRYQLLTDMTSKYFSGLKNVIKEGR
ncbi:MAG: flagellar basal body rod protein FlgB [Fimbriimonas sp.]